MPKQLKSNSFLNPKIWRHLVNFWTLVLYTFIIADFLTRNKAIEFLGPISAIYIALLAIYTAEKEFERWHDYNVGRHPGEIYVLAWTVLIITLLILEVIYYGQYRLPSEIFTTYIVVLGILAITKKSKSSYLGKKKRR